MKRQKELILKGEIAALGRKAPKKIKAKAFVITDWRKQSTKNAKELPVIIVCKHLPVELIEQYSWWTPDRVVGAVVAEGALMAHICIVTREMADKTVLEHFICVINIKNIHRRVKTGDLLEIEIIDNQEAAVKRIV